MKNFSSQRIYQIGFLLIVFLLIFSAYLQFFKGILPCPLCILQRVCLAILAVVFLIGSVVRPVKIGSLVLGFSASLFSLLGVFLAGRQVWLQHLPANTNENCNVSFEYMMQVLPFDQVIKHILQGSAECSQIAWEFMRLSLAEWSLIWFVGFFVVSIGLLVRKKT